LSFAVRIFEGNMMRNTFEILAGFLDRYECEVEGRAVTEPPAETQEDLRLLASGALAKEKLPELMAALNENRDWVAWLAQEVKAQRNREP
jgi:hypothetical protein